MSVAIILMQHPFVREATDPKEVVMLVSEAKADVEVTETDVDDRALKVGIEFLGYMYEHNDNLQSVKKNVFLVKNCLIIFQMYYYDDTKYSQRRTLKPPQFHYFTLKTSTFNFLPVSSNSLTRTPD